MSETCYRCDRKLTPDNSVLISGKNITVCQECADGVYEKCPKCNKYACQQDFFYVGDNSFCVWCISEKFIFCPHCCNFFPADRVVKIHGYFVCRNCQKEYFQKCSLCNKLVEEDEFEDVLINGNYEKICLKCWKENYFLCEDCQCTYPEQDACNYRGKLFCEECLRDVVAMEILDGKLKISASPIPNGNGGKNKHSGRLNIDSAESNAAFFEEGYADDYLGDGLDGKDNYLGDGLDE